jgi:CRISPR-associated protein Csb2
MAALAPSVFQSLVAAAGARGRGEFPFRFRSALLWLEKQPPPTLIVPSSLTSSGYSLSVPNNAMDVVAKAWSRGNYSNVGDANPATHRTMKRVRPTLLLAGDTAHYLWPLRDPVTEQIREQAETLREMARSLFALGWGIDLAVGDAEILADRQADALCGEKWHPDESAREGLRVPKEGTLDHLIRRHSQFLTRLNPEGLSPPPPVSVYRVVEYRPAFSRPGRASASFSLLKLDATGFRAFDPVRRTPRVAEMMRGVAERVARRAGWPETKISTVIMGHGELRGSSKHSPVESPRFAWLPLPTVETRGEGKPRAVGGIRRIIVTSFDAGFDDEIAWTRRALSGEELMAGANGTAEALLSLLPESDRMVREYVRPATTWATVTPVVLPGYDDPDHYRRRLAGAVVGADGQRRLLDRIAQRIDRLLQKAIVHSGLSQELAEHAEIEWRGTGFWPGSDLARRYTVPDHLKRFPRVHVRISWRDRANRAIAIPGPICIGGGRFYGLGLFAAVTE